MTAKGTLVPAESVVGRTVTCIEPPETLFFWGHGYISFVCGKCGCVLADNVFPTDIKNRSFRCNQCQAINQATDL